ncbi:hypothetical protein NA57DRAFT_36254 [Rhizodiscina lignyota]|uniref:Nucleoside transporter family n=1 Tax=Rhizodiscina lignyota TaxID=1504668 RepID=A0A9P4MCN0_9PEZI|nr:hypothetical protein NA57DRAFT_36254 [Rhizodiscina lignyota]
MERVKRVFRRTPSYQPLLENGGADTDHGNDWDERDGREGEKKFSWMDYLIFMLIGVAMLWAWNMFLAAGPYFQRRFQSSPWVLKNFQAAELSISTVANLGAMLLLTNLQARANYPGRIIWSLVINMVAFTLLAISTRLFTSVSAGVYFGFVLVMVLAASLAAGLCQNGVFAYVSGFGREEYPQGIMTGQAVAGVLPCIAQIVSVMGAPAKDKGNGVPEQSSTSAFSYFLTATAVSLLTLVAFLYLVARNRDKHGKKLVPDNAPAEDAVRRSVPMLTLLSKLRWLAGAVFLTFGITMVFPVFTQKIESVNPPAPDNHFPITQPASFIPLAFLFWNSGDLVGRLCTGIPALRLTSRPKLVFILSVARVIFIPMYLLCNIRNEGAKIPSDFFYLVIVQFLFGLTNGFIGSTCMMGAVDWVDPEEREAAGGFMGLCLVSGLTVGSLLSFLAAGS